MVVRVICSKDFVVPDCKLLNPMNILCIYQEATSNDLQTYSLGKTLMEERGGEFSDFRENALLVLMLQVFTVGHYPEIFAST